MGEGSGPGPEAEVPINKDPRMGTTFLKRAAVAAVGGSLLVGGGYTAWQILRATEAPTGEQPEYVPKGIALDLLQERLKDPAFRGRIFGKDANENPTSSEEQITEQLRGLFDIFFKKERENTRVFHAPKSQAAFPFTSINVADVARELTGGSARRANADISAAEPELSDNPEVKKFFIFSAGVTTTNGNQFTLSEEAFIEFMKQLQISLHAIKQGRQPRDYEIYTLGMPTNVFGEVSEHFVRSAKKEGFPAFGRLYGEFVESILEKEETALMEFYGWSMGANFAVNTGEYLINHNLVGQYRTKEAASSQTKTPKLQILVDNAAGYQTSPARQLMIPVGFVAEAVYQYVFHKKLIKGALEEGKFMTSLEPELAERGIVRKMDSVQSKLKKDLLNVLEFHPSAVLFEGQDPEQIEAEVYMRTGTADPTEFNPDKNRQAKEKRKAGKLPTINHANPKVWEFMANMSQSLPFYRDNMLIRWAKTAATVWNLRQQHSSA